MRRNNGGRRCTASSQYAKVACNLGEASADEGVGKVDEETSRSETRPQRASFQTPSREHVAQQRRAEVHSIEPVRQGAYNLGEASADEDIGKVDEEASRSEACPQRASFQAPSRQHEAQQRRAEVHSIEPVRQGCLQSR